MIDDASEFFNVRWAELTYYERQLTALRLGQPGLHCYCLPTCPKW